MTDDAEDAPRQPRGERSEPSPRSGRGQRIPHPRNGNGKPDVAALLEQNRLLEEQNRLLQQERDAVEERLERVEAGGMRTIDQAQPSKVINREADPEEMTPFVADIREQTSPTPENYLRKGLDYNYPLKHFAKPDGSIVQLQGDPGNRAYYRDKGYAELDEEQVRQWYSGEKQKVVAVQREKANLINTLRELIARDLNLKGSISGETEKAWDHMTVAELEAFLDEVMNIPDQNGKPRRRLRPPQRLIDAENRKEQRENDRLMAGVETNDTMTKEALEAKLKDPRSRGPR